MKFQNSVTNIELSISIISLDTHFISIYCSNSIKSKRLTLKLSRYHLPEKAPLLIALIKGSLFFPFIHFEYVSPTLSTIPNDLVVQIASYLSVSHREICWISSFCS
jgi:hypothetical protein